VLWQYVLQSVVCVLGAVRRVAVLWQYVLCVLGAVRRVAVLWQYVLL
jgi:hypothetical protein